MGLRERILNRYFGDLVAARVREATLAEEDRFWRHLSATGTKDLPHHELLENLRDSAEAYRANPLAYRIIELTTDYVLGAGVQLQCEDPDGQRFLDEWWHHPLNNLPLRVYELCTELSLSGELFVTFHTNPYDGLSYIRLIPAVSVDRIETNPEDIEDEWRFHQVGGFPAVGTGVGPAVLDRAASDLTGRWWDKEQCRHYAVNRLVGAVRGQGDLVPILPWLRRYKDWLTDRVRINKGKGAYLWWVKLTGADRRAIEAKKAQYSTPPNPGSIIVTNESEEWKALSPMIDAQAVEPDGRAMRLMVAAGAGLPLHFLSEGEGTNKATAQEMGGPTLRHFERRQMYSGWILSDIARHAARLSGRFGEDLGVEAEFEELTTGDNLTLARAAASIVGALKAAKAEGWIDDATAQQMLMRFAGVPALSSRRSDRAGRRAKPSRKSS